MTNNEMIIEFAKVLIQWGFWIMVYGFATMLIGYIILLIWGRQIGRVIMFLNDYEF